MDSGEKRGAHVRVEREDVRDAEDGIVDVEFERGQETVARAGAYRDGSIEGDGAVEKEEGVAEILAGLCATRGSIGLVKDGEDGFTEAGPLRDSCFSVSAEDGAESVEGEDLARDGGIESVAVVHEKPEEGPKVVCFLCV